LVSDLTSGTGSPRSVPTSAVSSAGMRMVAAIKSSGCEPTAKLTGSFSPRAMLAQ